MSNTDSMNFLIAEYNALRDEIVKRTEIQHQLISIAVVASGGFLSLVDKIPAKVFLAYPVLALVLAAAWSQSDIRIQRIGMYIRDHIEEPLIKAGELTAGWEHVFQSSSPAGKVGTLSNFISVGILVGTQILTVVLFLYRRANATSFTTAETALLIASFLVVVFTGFLILGSQRWSGRSR